MERVTLVLLLSALAWSEKGSRQLSLIYTPHLQSPGSHHPFAYQALPQAHGHGQSPQYNFWSNLGAGNSQQLKFVPLNSHGQGQGQQYFVLSPHSHVPHQSPHTHTVAHHDQTEHNPEDDTEVIHAAPAESSQRSESDEDTKVIQADQPHAAAASDFWTSSHDTVISDSTGFQRGSVEARPSNGGHFYKAPPSSSGVGQGSGFTRGHVEHRPSHQHQPQLRLTQHSAHEVKNLGFNRGAVEAKPSNQVSSQAVTFKRSAGPRVICYFANWSFYRKGSAKYDPENVMPELCTHILYAFATYDKNSMSLKESDPTVDSHNQFIERVVQLKARNPNLKVLVAVGGWSDSGDNKYSTLVNSLSNRRSFARESLLFLKRYKFDGISMDWHYPVCWQSDCAKGPSSDKHGFSELMRELKSVYSPEGYLVAASLSGYKEVIDMAYDIPKLSESLDFMNIMTYDYHGSWESRTGHLSPLYEGPPSEDLKPSYNSNFTMEYYVSKGADRSKLILGIPFYGQSYMLENQFDHSIGSLAEGPGNPGDYTQQAGMLAYYEICKKVKNDGWTVRKDTSGSWGPYAFKGNQWVSFDDVDSVRRKARYVTANSFGGVFAFTLDLDDFNNDCCNGDQPLLRTISKELLGTPFSFKRNDCSQKPQRPDFVPELTTTTPTPVRPTQSQRPSKPGTTPRPRPIDPTPNPSRCFYTTKPHPTDCNSYYSCVSEKEMLQHCPSSLHWNQNSQTCDWPERAGCRKKTDMEEGIVTVVQVPDAPETKPPPMQIFENQDCVTGEYQDGPTCDQYYLCSNGGKMLQMCGPGLHWNNQKRLCDWPKDAKCQTRSEGKDDMLLDEGCQEGEFLGSKRSCDLYYVCVHGSRMEFRCQGGLQWNAEAKVCDWPSNVKCTPSEPSDPVSVPIMPPTRPTSAPTMTPTQPTATTPVPSWQTSPTTTTTERQTSATFPSLMPTSAPEVVRPPSSDLSGDFMIVCYFTNWAWYRPEMAKYKPEHIKPDLCTHIVYGFAVLDYEQLVIKPHDSWADIDNKFYEQVTALKRAGKKVTVAIGGWNDSAGDKYSRLVNNAASRRRFIQHVVEFIKRHNFDGLDLDWEYPRCWQVACDKGPESDKPNFAAFVKELHDAFKPHGLLLSSAVSPSKTVIDAGYDVPALSRYLDWIAVMTYDFHGQWDKKTGHVAPLYFHEEDDFYYFNANYSINYWINQGTDRKKIVMGMPLYGQSFTLADPNDHGLNAPSISGGTAGKYTKASGFLAYYEICHEIQRNGWRVVYDETGAMGPYAYKGNQWVSFDDVAMIRKKSELIRDLDIGGGMVWALDLDDFKNSCGQGEYPLLTTIRSVLGRRRTGSSKISHVQYPTKKEGVKKPESSTGAVAPTPFTPIRSEEVEHCDEAYRRHEKDCSRYYQCIFGRYVEQSCPPGTVWNKDHCDWPGNTDCQPDSGTKPKPKPPTTPRPQFPSPTTTRPTTLAPAPVVSTTEFNPPSGSFGTTSYRPPRRTTTAAPTKSPEWCRLNWCPTPKPIPPNKHELVNVPPSDYKVVCYFTNWAWYRPGSGKYKPEDIDFNLCTHIAYGFAVLNPTTLVIRPHDGWADIDNQFYKQVAQLRQRGVKVVLALGGWNDSLGDKYSRMANDPEARRRFIDHAIEFVETWDFDGLDLDWEYPKCWQVDCEKGPASDKQAFAALVRELKQAFEPRGLLLSAAVSPNKKVIDEGYDVPTVSKYLDWIAVMTYDYHGQWDKKTGHNAPLYHHPESETPFFNANYSINYWIDQGADRKKIVMGMPMYGQSFTIVDPSNTGLNSKSSGGAQAGEFTRSAGFLAYYEICNYVQNRGWTVVRDESSAIGPYAYKGNQWVSFDDIDQTRRKAEYIKQMGLGGGMIWALDLDDFRGSCGCEEHPLLKTINRVLRKYPVPDPNCRRLN